ncbi:MAG TPA: VPLPA-CTERM-specific exosortase XrtD [Steroidobacteraceae bacterium]|nr:VPLPA-CTERM-specific exosortase XrtD [Steroidobacteraceae bacterium]
MTTQASVYPAPGDESRSWRFSALDWAILAFALVTAVIPFLRVLGQLWVVWGSPEYSHCMIIPLVSAFLIWRERAALVRTRFDGSWLGIAVLAAGAGLWAIGELSTIWTIEQYGFLAVIYGLVIALVGPQVFRRLWMAMLILVFTIPFPVFFTNSLSLHLQLLSSALGVAVIRLFDIPVYLDGNVIDLGVYKLQVAEACSGLRYLFPLMTLAFIVTYFFRAPFWKRAALFLASVPIAILMNSLRIGLIGVSVAYWGQKMAEGVLHYFEGWVVFMISTALLLALAAVLVRFGRPPMRLRDAMALDMGPAAAASPEQRARALPAPFLAATALTTVAALLSAQVHQRTEIQPSRAAFIDFPMHLGGWDGQRSAMGAVYLNQLKLSDYLFATYQRPADVPVNVWVAYYDSQRKGDSTHSPASCLPGGGWQFQTFAPYTLRVAGSRLTVNRAVIVHGEDRELMYYWFPQRGRDITSDYLLKWYLLWDAITRDRTDGALVRLIVPLPRGTSLSEGDSQLASFARSFVPALPRYVPN